MQLFLSLVLWRLHMATRLAPSREWSRIRESKSYQAETLEKSHHGSFQSVQTQEAKITRLC